MVLVDTNVLFALLVANTPWSVAARRLYAADDDWRTEAHALVELTSILTRCVRTDDLAEHQAVAVLHEAELRLDPFVLAIAHDAAIEAALRFGVSAYDARFLVLARELRRPLVTEDARLRRAAPALTCSVDDALH
jgi:predicted nucleic acid-binding protein